MNKRIISIPPMYLLISIIVGLVFYFFVPEMGLIKFPLNLFFGIPLMLTGCCLIHISYLILKRHKTSTTLKASTCLITGGLYKYSRNPMYVGVIVFLTGLAFVLGNLLSFVSPILFFFVVNWMFVPYEEEKMEREIGAEYLLYKNKVRRWF